MGAFRSILVDTDATADVHPAFQQACDLAVRLAARVTLVDVIEHLPSSAYNVFMRKLEADVADGGQAALARLAQTRPDVQCKVSAASETQPAKLLAVFVVDTHETELVIPFGN